MYYKKKCQKLIRMEGQINKKWNMLDSYCEGQVIYGRDAEISSIKESILYNIQTFVYGKSGIGKTSLLQAGIFPQLRQAKYFPVIIRLSFYNEGSLNHVVKKLVEEEAEREDLTINKFHLHYYVIDDTKVSDSPLFEYFSKVRFEDETHTPYIPVLIFDQFEETINNEEQWQRTVDFLKEDLYDLMDNSNIIYGDSNPYTNYRIVFSMREDYLYCLEDIVDRYSLWELRYNRYRIKALDDEGASDVIRLTSGKNGLENGKEDKIVDLIIKIVKNNSGTRFSEINTALLSLICSLLYENSKDECINYQDLKKVNVYLNSYYDTICDEVGPAAANYLEERLLTKDGRRSLIDELEIISSGKVHKNQLDYLVDKRFLRRIKTDSTSIRYEYIHDLFARMVFKRRMNEKARRYHPEISSISKRIDRILFIKNFLLTIIIWLFIDSVYIFILSTLVDDFSFHIAKHRFLLIIFSFIMLLYLLPLVVKRLHDVGKSGWWISLCGLFPMIYVLFMHNSLFNISLGIWSKILSITGFCVCFLFIGWLCIRPSVLRRNPAKYSVEYEEIYKGVIINNIQFAKSFFIELSLWIANYCFAMMVIIIILNVDLINYNDFLIFKWFGLDLAVPSVLGLLPFALCFSPSLKARIKSIGYPIVLTYIPYFNILLLIEGLFSNQLLHTLKLRRDLKKRKQSSEDDVLLEIDESFFQDYEDLNNNRTKLEESYYIKLAMIFVPFYSFGRFLNCKLSLGQRIRSSSFIWINCAFFYCITIVCLFGESLFLLLISFFTCVIQSILAIFVLFKRNKLYSAYIINEIEKNPHYNINQIENDNLLLSSKWKIKIIKKLREGGYIKRVESDKSFCWEIDEQRCIKYIKYYD